MKLVDDTLQGEFIKKDFFGFRLATLTSLYSLNLIAILQIDINI